jgi:hypothetical protein
MNIELIHKLTHKPRLYEKGNSVMWTDPYISKQLLELLPDSDCWNGENVTFYLSK